MEEIIKLYGALEDESFKTVREINLAVEKKTIEIIDELTKRDDKKAIIEMYNNSDKIEKQVIDTIKLNMIRQKEKEKQRLEEIKRKKQLEMITQEELRRKQLETIKIRNVLGLFISLIIIFSVILVGIITY